MAQQPRWVGVLWLDGMLRRKQKKPPETGGHSASRLTSLPHVTRQDLAELKSKGRGRGEHPPDCVLQPRPALVPAEEA